MLRKINEAHCRDYKIETDYNVPLDLESPSYRGGYTVYYRLVFGAKSLIEIGLDDELGQITRLVLVLFNEYKSTSSPYCMDGEIVEGVGPVFDLGIFRDKKGEMHWVDEEKKFYVVCGPDFMSIYLDEDRPVSKRYKLGRSILGIDTRGMLQEITVLNISENDLKLILRNKGQTNKTR